MKLAIGVATLAVVGSLFGQETTSDPVVDVLIRFGGSIPPTVVLWYVWREQRNDNKVMTDKVLEAVPALSSAAAALEKSTEAQRHTAEVLERLSERVPPQVLWARVEHQLDRLEDKR